MMDAPGVRATAKMEGVAGAITSSIETPWGLLVIGGPGPNAYSEEALARHRLRHRAGRRRRLPRPRGLGGRRAPAPASARWSTESGDDLYDAGNRAFCLGGAVLGVAAL